LVGLPDQPGNAAYAFKKIAAAGVMVDMIVQSISREGRSNLSFTVAQEDLDAGLKAAGALAEKLGCPSPTSCPKVAKLSVFGVGMKSHTGVAARMFNSLSKAGINVDMISTSEVRLNVVVEGQQGEKALKALQEEFADVMV